MAGLSGNKAQGRIIEAESELLSLFKTDQILIDVRAPIEFAQGAFPQAINLPILNDKQRQQVGICYKEQGPDAATALGHQLVSGAMKDACLSAWQAQYQQNPDAALYCFRGGQRSQISCAWLEASGIQPRRIDGGYKRLRTLLLKQFQQLPELIVIAGKTGSGKTAFLNHCHQKAIARVDLEHRANHRGSAFGHNLSPQPSQIDFENSVAIDFLKLGAQKTFVEDEGRLIGRLNLPLPLQETMQQAPIWFLEDSLSSRVDRIYHDYITLPTKALTAQGKQALPYLQSRYQDALKAIAKRLGGVRFKEVNGLLQEAFSTNEPALNSNIDTAADGAIDGSINGSIDGHRAWIEILLRDYYDPMYNYQLEKKAHRIVQRGDFETLSAALNRF